MKDLIREIAEPSKRVLLAELHNGPRNVSELVSTTGLKQPNISNHLAKMRAKGFVRATKLGRQVYYSLASGDIANSLQILLSREAELAEEPFPLHEVAVEFAKLAVHGNEERCSALIHRLNRQGVDLSRIYSEVLATSMQHVGRWYEVQAVDVAEEHLASAITERMMTQLMQFASPLRDGARVAVLGCVPENQHAIGIRMLSDMLRMHGWRTIYLGANVPAESFISASREHKPDVIMISCARIDGFPHCQDLIQKLRASDIQKRFLIGLGGRAVNENPDLFRELNPHFMAQSLAEFLEEVLPNLALPSPVGSATTDD
ncbi:MAG: metalloregulator ArsR/SmtB family transcription factor [Chthonomonas sp.]|nr:metalloregulator ArsR/SmtB family transcription factor [Chthonomonas sp.]